MNTIRNIITPRVFGLFAAAAVFIFVVIMAFQAISAANAAVTDYGHDGKGIVTEVEVDGSYLERQLAGEDLAEAQAVRDILNF